MICFCKQNGTVILKPIGMKSCISIICLETENEFVSKEMDASRQRGSRRTHETQ